MTETQFLLVGISLVLVAVSIPMLLRRVPPNPVYGLRVPATYADEWVWFEANARFGRDLLLQGVALAVLAVALPGFGLPMETALPAWCLIAAATSLVTVVVAWRRANRLLQERRQAGNPAAKTDGTRL